MTLSAKENKQNASVSSGAPSPKLLNSYEIQMMMRRMIRDQGHSLDALLEGTSLDRDSFDDPSLRLSAEEELAVYSRLASLNKDPLLAVDVGMMLDLTNYGVLGFAMAASKTLREALQLSVEYAPLISLASHVSLTNVRYTGVAMTRLAVQPSPADALTQAMEVESWFASFHKIINQLLGEDFHFDSVHFAHRCEADSVAPFRARFHCPVYFEQAQNAVYFLREQMSRRLPHAQPEYAAVTRDLCRRDVETLRGERGLVGAVKAYLDSSEGVPTLQQAADHFNMASRTLRRRLETLGTSWQEIADGYRFNEARRLLLSTHYTLEAIAQVLGYSDARSFRTAFKRWAGVTPSVFRQQQ